MSTPAHSGPNLTQCGLPGLSTIPYGIHMCHFYEKRTDLADALVPYFAAGLRNNERCIWITADPLDAAAAGSALRDAGVDVDAATRKGSLVIREHSGWYSDSAGMKGAEVVDLWLEEERRALERGYSGLRITGNTSFLTPEAWDPFMEYEALLNQALAARRIVTLCSYYRKQCAATEVVEVVQRHNVTLERPDAGWRVFSSERKQKRG